MAAPQKKGKKRVTLKYDGEPGHDVFVAGTFNDWDPRKKRMKAVDKDGHYKAVLMLPPGRYEYKFVVDGEWRHDRHNPQSVPDGIGSVNSVVDVG